MEESNDMYCERDSLSSEKSKRRLKTPAQVQALEKFYNEHKYPSESMKLQFAEQVGLSEKQVSGWFCHRRSKDKKLLQDEGYANRKHSISADVIHDSSSGLRQESCNSTKQMDRHFDGKEVESNWYHGVNFSAAAPEQSGQLANVESYGVANDGSSGSSTTSYEKLLKQGETDCSVKPVYSFWDEDYRLTGTKGMRKRGRMMDSRSSLRANHESPVYLVKLKLGRQYREDGPPLATNFDPLPPGAFDSPVRDSNAEPYYVGDSVHPRACGVNVIVGEHKVHNGYRSEKISSGLCPQGSGFGRKLRRFNHQSDFTGSRMTPKAADVKNNDLTQTRTFILDDEDEDFAGEASDDYRQHKMKSFKFRRLAGGLENSISHPHLNNLKANANKPLLHPLSAHNYIAPMSQKELFGAKISKPNIMSKTNGNLKDENNVKPKGKLKLLKKNFDKQNGFHKQGKWPDTHLSSDTQMTRKGHDKDFGS